MAEQHPSSDRQRLDALLRHPDQLLESIFNSLEEAVFVVSSDRRLLRVNQAAVAMFGYSATELAEQSTEILHVDQEHYRDFGRQIQDAFENNRVARFDFEFRRKNGDIFPTEHTVSPLRDAAGNHLGIISVVRDITRRRQVEERIRASEQKFRALFEHNLDAAFLTFPDGRVTAANPAACRLFGRSEEELCLLGRRGVIDPDDPRLPAALEERRRTGQVHGLELTAIRRDGERFPVEVDSVVLPGEEESAFVFLRDISQRKAAEQTLKTSEKNYRRVVEEQTEIVTRFAADGTLLFVNEACCRTFGKSREELLGRHWAPDVHPDDLAAVEEQLARLAPENPVVTIQNRIVTGDGELRWMQFVNRGIFSPAGRLLEIQVVGRDITEQKKNLEQEYHAQKLDALGRLAGGIAHDLNNLLVPVIGLSELLSTKLKAEGSPLHQLAGEIETAGHSAARLVAQILSFGRRQHLEKRAEDVNRIIVALQPIVKPMFRSGIEVSLDLAGDLRPMHADRGKIEQVLTNLVINACDAMPDGGDLTIRTKRGTAADFTHLSSPLAQADELVLIEVADTGGGIPEEIVDRIFDPYFTTKETGKGSGLGLATVLGIVKQHGGEIRVTSDGATGTTFVLAFPATAGDQDEIEAPLSGPGHPRLTGTETILVVDDEKPVRQTICSQLSEAGYTPIEAAGGALALELFGKIGGSIDLILTDMTMPGMNGRELIAAIRKLDARVPVILLSGYSQTLFENENDREDGPVFLQKPFRPEELLLCIRSVLD